MALLTQLQSYFPHDSTETAHWQRTIEFLQTTPRPFHRETLEGHITGSAIVINPNGDRMLLLHHRQLNRWLQPGGHCDGNPDALAIAIQETQEETGLTAVAPISESIFDIDVHRIPAKSSVPAHWHYDIRYLLQASDTEVFNQSDREVIAIQWLPLSQLVHVTPSDPSFQRVQDKLAAYLLKDRQR